MISEGDLLHRPEAGTGHERPRWLRMLMSRELLAGEFLREHSRRVGDLMTRDVVTAAPDTPVADIATLLERHRIKRVPIVDGVGSSASSAAQSYPGARYLSRQSRTASSDAALREKVVSRLRSEPWLRPSLVNVTVADGKVDLWGIVDSATQKQALRVAVEIVPGVKAVNDNVLIRPADAET